MFAAVAAFTIDTDEVLNATIVNSGTFIGAVEADPTRFRHRQPSPPKLPTVAWINDPAQREARIQSAA